MVGNSMVGLLLTVFYKWKVWMEGKKELTPGIIDREIKYSTIEMGVKCILYQGIVSKPNRDVISWICTIDIYMLTNGKLWTPQMLSRAGVFGWEIFKMLV
jgi:hypothetical protein